MVYTRRVANRDTFYYAYHNGTRWLSRKIVDAGHGTAFFHSGGATLDHEDPRFVYLSRTIGRWNQVEQWFTPDEGRTRRACTLSTSEWARMSRPAGPRLGEHAPHNVMDDPDEIARFHDRCSVLMRELLDELATSPDRPRTFPEIEDALGWPRRRIASVLGGVAHLRHTEFGGARPYRFHDERRSASGRWEMWMDAAQARAVRAAQRA